MSFVAYSLVKTIFSLLLKISCITAWVLVTISTTFGERRMKSPLLYDLSVVFDCNVEIGTLIKGSDDQKTNVQNFPVIKN